MVAVGAGGHCYRVDGAGAGGDGAQPEAGEHPEKSFARGDGFVVEQVAECAGPLHGVLGLDEGGGFADYACAGKFGAGANMGVEGGLDAVGVGDVQGVAGMDAGEVFPVEEHQLAAGADVAATEAEQ